MTQPPRYKRIVLKISGEGLCAPGGRGLDATAMEAVADEIAPVVEMGVQVALVVGGGNLLRGRDLSGNPDIRRVNADYMGMLATVINAIALQETLVSRGIAARALSAIPMPTVCEPFTVREAQAGLEGGSVVILAGGTGNPFFTTDTCAALRAAELDADVLLKATKVDGVYSDDPVTHPDAKRHARLTCAQVLADKLGVMDLTAVSLCMTSGIAIMVLELARKGNLLAAVCGQDVGTLITD